jgi:site-specific recombinase XerD
VPASASLEEKLDTTTKGNELAVRSTPRALAIGQNTGSYLLSNYLADSQIRGLAKITLEKYVKTYRDFFLTTGSMPLTAIKPHHIRDFLAWQYSRGASDETLRGNLCALRSLFRFAESIELVDVSPARAIQTRKLKRRIPKPLTESEINSMIEAAQTPRDKALIETLYATGCRIAEIVGMRFEDVSWEARSIRVLGKGNKERLVPLNGRAIERLQLYLGKRTTGWIFQSAGKPDQCGYVTKHTGFWIGRWRTDYEIDGGELTFSWRTVRLGKLSQLTRVEANQKLAEMLAGKLTSRMRTVRLGKLVGKLPTRPRPVKAEPLTTRGVYWIVQQIAARAGLKGVHPHRFRHSFATHLLDGGADIYTIATLMGHASLTSTQIYTEVSQKKMLEAMQRHPHWEKP